eukprot:NODE_1337_length_1277_cov_1.591681.p1 type:complete len:209 gc:universal NODE_1337_length_1277_cov_1.591681:1040-414(-)
MTDYLSPEKIRYHFGRLNASQDSISAISNYLNFHSRYSDQIMEIWKDYILESTVEQQLLLLYVLNDLIQVSRRKSSAYQNWCVENLVEVWNKIKDSLSLPILLKCQRLFDVWYQRRLFPLEFVTTLKASSKKNPFLFILQEVQAALKTKSALEKEEYLQTLVSYAEDCRSELKSLLQQNQVEKGSPRQVSNMLKNLDPIDINKLLNLQ